MRVKTLEQRIADLEAWHKRILVEVELDRAILRELARSDFSLRPSDVRRSSMSEWSST